eukprot:3059019-Amphidinium_carterae.1
MLFLFCSYRLDAETHNLSKDSKLEYHLIEALLSASAIGHSMLNWRNASLPRAQNYETNTVSNTKQDQA